MLILLILFLGLTPSLLSIWAVQRADQRVSSYASRTSPTSAPISYRLAQPRPLDLHYVEGIGHMIGDLTCQFNARSSYIRCAVNPMGDCKTCLQYQPIPDPDAQNPA
jgi:hypothetical protein